jgi:hypothetical protein
MQKRVKKSHKKYEKKDLNVKKCEDEINFKNMKRNKM